MLIAQITDLHIKRGAALAYGVVDTSAYLERAVAHLNRLDPRPDLVLITGDLVDLGQPDEYARLKALLAPLAMPFYLVPGNHDHRGNLVAGFPEHAYLPRDGFIQYVVEGWPVRLIALDTIIPGEGGGLICDERLAWLEARLSEAPEKPTVLFLHHPPFHTAIGHMDKVGLANRDAFAAVVRRHPQVERVLAGHLHRPITVRWAGTVACTCPSTAHQVVLDLRPVEDSAFNLEPPGFMLHLWQNGSLITHCGPIGDFPGPYPFHGDDGKLID